MAQMNFGGATAKTYNVGASASWELDIFGKLTAAKRGAAAALQGSRTSCSIDVVSFLVKHLAGIQQIDFRLGSTGREQNGLFRNLLAGCNQGIQQCFIEVVSQAKVANGTMSVSDMLKEINAENLARQAKAVHEVQLLMHLHQRKHLTN